MKKILAALLCVLVLLSALSVLCFAEYPVEGRDEPSIETAVENTIGKHIPTGKDVSDSFFGVINAIKESLQRVSDFLGGILNSIKESISSIQWLPGWIR